MAKKKVRVRSKRLDQLDETKLSLAIWLITEDLAKDGTSPPEKPSEPGQAPSGEKS
jgi:hypothetical protein